MDDRIVVLQVLGSLGLGGAESRMMDVFRHIDRTKYEFAFLSMDDSNEYFEQEIRQLGAQVYRIPAPSFRHLPKHIKELRRVMRDSKCNVVHAHTSFHCGLAMLAAKMEHVPIRISHARTTGSVRRNRIKQIALFVGRALITKFSTHRFAISQAAGFFLFGNTKFEILPNAIDTSLYQRETKVDSMKIRRELGLPEEAMIIGQIGRFNSMKNHSFSINWFHEFQKYNSKACLAFIGFGSEQEHYKKQVAELGDSQKVFFLGGRGDVPRVIHAFDLILFPSIFEGLGGVSLEAQAAGIPVVQSDSLPAETDMGLGLIKRCSLDAPLSEWTEAVNESLQLARPDYNTINQAFISKKYSLDSEIKRLCEVYSGKS